MSVSASPAPAPAEARTALISAIGCYVIWGFLPLLFMGMAAQGFTAPEILAQRAVWAVLFAGVLVLMSRQWGQVKRVLGTPSTLAWLAGSTVLIGLNWGVYVWATTHGATLEASLGYYINPLLNMAAGALLFREKISRGGKIAIGLAFVGVLIQALALGRPPWISIVLALSFCAYGVIRKRVPADAQTGLFVECLLLLPLGLIFLTWLQLSGPGAVGLSSPANLAWAMINGPATVLPLALFAWSARRLPLSAMGFIQFIAPTLQFACGVWAGEAFTPLRAVSFVFIWAGAMVFAVAAVQRARATRRAVPQAE